MNPLQALSYGKRYIGGVARRRAGERRADAQQHRLGLSRQPRQELLDLMIQAEQICAEVKSDAALGEYFTSNNPWSNRPWRQLNYWNGWYALARIRRPSHILEIGTAFGFSTIAMARGSGENLKLLVSLDLGNLGKLFSDGSVDSLPYVTEGISRYRQQNSLNFEYLQFSVNTQPPPYTDEDGNPVQCPHWRDNQELVGLLGKISFDMILIDGLHIGDGLYNDLRSFFGCGKSGSLIVCDDLQHEDVANSLSRFVREQGDIADYCIWRFLRADSEYGGSLRRDQGLILKK